MNFQLFGREEVRVRPKLRRAISQTNLYICMYLQSTPIYYPDDARHDKRVRPVIQKTYINILQSTSAAETELEMDTFLKQIFLRPVIRTDASNDIP